MAGDPQQLGPIVVSPLARQYGLDISLLQRLMASPLYSRGARGYDGRCITKLVRSFRSHPALLHLPAHLFYNGDLLPHADPTVVDRLLQFPGLTEEARGKTPLLVHGVVGADMREATSPSYFNPTEAAVVLDYVERLLAEGVAASDIGVIAPYKKQVLKLRERLQDWGLGVMVGSVEEFQGQEKVVIIVTTVRSSEPGLSDASHQLGFLANPRRFNVAITRAQALLVVVCNPHVLSRDPHWGRLVTHALECGCYKGCPYPRQRPHQDVRCSVAWVLFNFLFSLLQEN